MDESKVEWENATGEFEVWVKKCVILFMIANSARCLELDVLSVVSFKQLSFLSLSRLSVLSVGFLLGWMLSLPWHISTTPIEGQA